MNPTIPPDYRRSATFRSKIRAIAGRPAGFQTAAPRRRIAGLAFRLAGSCALSMTLATPAVAADDFDQLSTSNWKYTVGAGAMVAPNYEGSKHYVVQPLPMVAISWRDTLSLSAEGLKLSLHPLPDKGFFVTGGVGYWFGRKEGVDKHHGDTLRGLGNLSGGAVGKFETGYRYGPVQAGIEVARDIDDDRDGTTVTPKLSYRFLNWGDFHLTGKLAASWADEGYMQSMFGVTPLQAARSIKHYSAFSAGAGMKDAGVGLAADYRISGGLSMTAFANASRLLGDAADSPIVKTQGSKNQISGGLGVVYRF